jgi:hypothetical protein
MGMRAGLGALGEPLPGVIPEAPSIEVAAEFTGIYRILMWGELVDRKNREVAITKVPIGTTVWCGFGTKHFFDWLLCPEDFTFAAPGH